MPLTAQAALSGLHPEHEHPLTVDEADDAAEMEKLMVERLYGEVFVHD